jgi:hypothetical protein
MPTFKISPVYPYDHVLSTTVHPEYASIEGLALYLEFDGVRRKHVRIAATFGDVSSQNGLWFSLRINGTEIFSARHSGNHGSLHLEQVIELEPKTEHAITISWAAAMGLGSGTISTQSRQIQMSAIIVDDVRQPEDM